MVSSRALGLQKQGSGNLRPSRVSVNRQKYFARNTGVTAVRAACYTFPDS